MEINAIAAVARNGVIGNKGQLPWHLPGDLKRFRQLTMGDTILIGRRTLESIGRSLDGRNVLVLSREPSWKPPRRHNTARVCTSVQEAMFLAPSTGSKRLWVCGGAQVYRQLLPMVQRLYLTMVDADYEGDVFFPLRCGDLGRGAWRRWRLVSAPPQIRGAPNYYYRVWEKI